MQLKIDQSDIDFAGDEMRFYSRIDGRLNQKSRHSLNQTSNYAPPSKIHLTFREYTARSFVHCPWKRTVPSKCSVCFALFFMRCRCFCLRWPIALYVCIIWEDVLSFAFVTREISGEYIREKETSIAEQHLFHNTLNEPAQ